MWSGLVLGFGFALGVFLFLLFLRACKSRRFWQTVGWIGCFAMAAIAVLYLEDRRNIETFRKEMKAAKCAKLIAPDSYRDVPDYVLGQRILSKYPQAAENCQAVVVAIYDDSRSGH